MKNRGFVVGALFAVGCGASGQPTAVVPPPSVPATGVQDPPTTPAGVVDSLRPLKVALTDHNLVRNASFEALTSLPWMPSFTAPAEGDAAVEGGAYCLHVKNAGTRPWDAQFRHRQMTIQKGHVYAVRFKIGATVATTLTAKVGMSGPPYKSYWQESVNLDSAPKVVDAKFTMAQADDATAEFAFHVGGSRAAKVAPFSVCVDDVVLEDPAFEPTAAAPPAPIPDVLVNQVGYLPDLAKVAIVKTAEAAPVAWTLADRAGEVLAKGTTEVRGLDPASGDRVHTADFTSFSKPGRGYTLRAAGGASHPFDIGPDLYRKLERDALAFFYQLRSGVAITMPYAGDPKWTHPAGHPGDKSVHCAADAGCDYALDVSGGWYDAGDQGKYVVNGGITVWTLLDAYERAEHERGAGASFADGTSNIPENHNGVPDLLDEVRWELDFMMKMQVPEGAPLAGMVHHKIHDVDWTALGTSPDRDPVARALRPVSTAATLNVAATAAQCARVWRSVDRAFADRCLRSAERAWTAAVAHPEVYIPASDSNGGGAYEDSDVSDEFYWAAAELFITTGKDVYQQFLAASPHRTSVPAFLDDHESTPQTWQHTAALGTISLAVVPGRWSPTEGVAARAAIVKAADAYLDLERGAGYAVAFRPGEHGLPWGSNGLPLNAAIELGLAYDFTKDPRYRDAVENILSYILGRNPLDQSYVTGYGARPLRNPHHRFWAHQADAAFPSPPPGVLSGGPNSHMQDPYVLAAGLRGCPPMKCFADNIEAYSVNEEAINWNAALVWVVAFLNEQAGGGPGRRVAQRLSGGAASR